MDSIRIKFTRGVMCSGALTWPSLEELCEEAGQECDAVREIAEVENWAGERREARRRAKADEIERIHETARNRIKASAIDYADTIDALLVAVRRTIKEAPDARELAAIARAAPALGQEIARLIRE